MSATRQAASSVSSDGHFDDTRARGAGRQQRSVLACWRTEELLRGEAHILVLVRPCTQPHCHSEECDPDDLSSIVAAHAHRAAAAPPRASPPPPACTDAAAAPHRPRPEPTCSRTQRCKAWAAAATSSRWWRCPSHAGLWTQAAVSRAEPMLSATNQQAASSTGSRCPAGRKGNKGSALL